MSNKIIYKNIITFHPGYYINKFLEELKITQDELAQNLNIPLNSLAQLINGHISVTEELASKLSRTLGLSPKTWISLNKKYLEKLNEIEQDKNKDLITLMQ